MNLKMFKIKSGVKWYKTATPLLVVAVLFALLTIYFMIHIGYWIYSTYSASSTMDTIQTEEVVGIDVDQTDGAAPLENQMPFVSVDFTDMKKRNADITAWLKMDSVGLDIPLVQTTDNEYYLNHDLDKKTNKLGWVFFDTRSNTEFLGTNTVLYGHNAANKQMFGSLKKLLNSDPEKKEQNEIIQLTTESKEMVFQIVSVYVTEYDDWHYVQQVFTSDASKTKFLDRMREKNELKIFDRNDLSVHDKYLTFSTCYGPAGTTKRLVVQARLVAEK
jgi:sortase B